MREHLHQLAPDARRAVAAAESEAITMSYDRVGTEHLLLGLLCGDADGAARMLHEAGATLPAARHKVLEAVPPPAGGSSRPLPTTPRADRAVGRAVRFSHHHHAGAVTSEHLLWGVLDVEGTAGQVLRGLGVDVDRLHASLESPESASTTAPDGAAPAVRAPLRCPSCAADLNGNIAYRAVETAGEHGPRQAVVFLCGSCGHVLGATFA